MGAGLQTRGFCFVSDGIAGTLALSKSSEHFFMNIGNPAEFTMLECAKLVIEVTGSKSVVQFEPLPEDDPDAAPISAEPSRFSIGSRRLIFELDCSCRSGTSKQRCRLPDIRPDCVAPGNAFVISDRQPPEVRRPRPTSPFAANLASRLTSNPAHYRPIIEKAVSSKRSPLTEQTCIRTRARCENESG